MPAAENRLLSPGSPIRPVFQLTVPTQHFLPQTLTLPTNSFRRRMRPRHDGTHATRLGQVPQQAHAHVHPVQPTYLADRVCLRVRSYGAYGRGTGERTKGKQKRTIVSYPAVQYLDRSRHC